MIDKSIDPVDETGPYPNFGSPPPSYSQDPSYSYPQPQAYAPVYAQDSPYAAQGPPYAMTQGNPSADQSRSPYATPGYSNSYSPPGIAPSNSPYAPSTSASPLALPQGGSSTFGAVRGGGLLGGLNAFASGETSARLLNAPPSFQRAPMSGLLYTAFQPLTLFGLGTRLEDGFSTVPPPSAAVPHPFAAHDVSEQDWVRFLHDVKSAGSASPEDRLAPMAMRTGFLTELLTTRGFESRTMDQKRDPAMQIVDHWNHHFFHPRCIEVFLTQSDEDDSLIRDDYASDFGRLGFGFGGGMRSGRWDRRELRRGCRDDVHAHGLLGRKPGFVRLPLRSRSHSRGSYGTWRLTVCYRPYSPS
ncbi:hypothetical protein A0H81_02680 [Grifola frondosa]|uniref:Uncharacterized protein n=1 Tax=Grifola frondosa TaxID=5627 RepID=A0A1C7MMV8_GRIFR|nr:hypothetical protein A0H81_02680 [Grifola frondosa]